MKLLFTDIGKEKPESYLRKHGQELLMAVTDEDSAYLTLLAAGGGWDLLCDDMKASFLSRGLVAIDKEGKAGLTGLGMDAVSCRAIFGRERSAGPFPFQFLSMLMSVIGSGTIPASSKEKYLSSGLFTARFPFIGAEKATEAAMLIISSFLCLGIAEADSDGMLYLSEDASARFAKLGPIDAIGYIIAPDCYDSRRKNLAKALSLLALSRGGDEKRICAFIASASGYDIADDLGSLETLFFIERKNGLIYASDMTPDDPLFSVSSDFSISVSGNPCSMLYAFAEPVSLGEHISQWTISRQSVKTAFSLGFSYEDVVSEIKQAATYPVAEPVFMRILSWYESLASLKVARGVVLAADERNARIIDSLSTLQMHILGRLGKDIFLMNPATEKMWRRILANEGFDMLPRTKGPQFAPVHEEIRHFEENAEEIRLPEERAVPYSAELREKLEEASDSPLRTFLIRSGLIYRDDMPVPDLFTANGLYYQEKLSIINTAIANGGKILAEMLSGDAFLGHPEKEIIGEEAFVIIDGRERIPIARIWKVTLVSAAVISGEIRTGNPDPSDNDSL